LDATFAKFKQSGLHPFLLAFFLYIWLVLGGILLMRLFY
ncbi:MAG: YeiH family putative sulfate export transporter, partial [Prevotella nanceiensis]|nr:YeiH family putative sulfate export transporter [Hoylesella nanceiensis]